MMHWCPTNAKASGQGLSDCGRYKAGDLVQSRVKWQFLRCTQMRQCAPTDTRCLGSLCIAVYSSTLRWLSNIAPALASVTAL